MAKDRKIDKVILGLLSHENLTGYDIKKRIDGQISFFWKGSFGNIYPALASLEEEGLIRRPARQPNDSYREKILYSITAKGKKELLSWLKEESAQNDLRYETLLKVFFGGFADREITIDNIRSFEEKIRSDLSLLKTYRKNLKDLTGDEDHLHFYLTVLFGINTYEAYLKWCKEAVKKLEN